MSLGSALESQGNMATTTSTPQALHYMLELATRFHLQTLSTMKLQEDCFALVPKL